MSDALAGTMTTNKKGNGNFHLNVGRFPATTTFFVDVFNTAKQGSVREPCRRTRLNRG
jgi:hypothetical protein